MAQAAAKDKEHKPRRMFRDRRTGQLGYLVERHGKEVIRLDRPAQELYAAFDPDTWVPEVSDRPLTKMQVGRLSFAADRELCKALAKFPESKQMWEALRDEKKSEWVSEGPAHDEDNPVTSALRRKLYDTIKKLFPGAR